MTLTYIREDEKWIALWDKEEFLTNRNFIKIKDLFF